MTEHSEAQDTALSQQLSCWRLRRDGCEDTYWDHYPGLAETSDSMEVTTVYWLGGDHD